MDDGAKSCAREVAMWLRFKVSDKVIRWFNLNQLTVGV